VSNIVRRYIYIYICIYITWSLLLIWLFRFITFFQVILVPNFYHFVNCFMFCMFLFNSVYYVFYCYIYVFLFYVYIFSLLCMFCSVYSVFILLFYVLFVCKCVLYYCHRVSTQLQLTNTHISYQIIIPLVFTPRQIIGLFQCFRRTCYIHS